MAASEDKKLKVLIMSQAVLDKSNSAGSTFSNFFHGMDGVELASLYFGYGEPNTDLEMSCFQVNEKSLLRHLLNKNVPSGRVVVQGKTDAVSMNGSEKKSFDFMRTIRWQVFFWARELIWKLISPQSPELDGFIKNFEPDVIMLSANDTCFVSRECRGLSKRYGLPICAFIGDDIYSLRRVSFSPLFWIDRLIKRASHRKLVKKCSKLFVMTDMAKAEFDRAFKTDCALLTKSLDFEDEPRAYEERGGDVIRFVYTGNLYAGRWKSLAALGRTLQRLNDENACAEGKSAELVIYSMTPMTKRMTSALNIPSVRFMGGVPASEIPSIQQGADVLVHAESMSKKEMLIVRLSFSTKLVDYMHVPRCILAIGPREQASMDHLIVNDAAVAVTDEAEMYEKVRELAADPKLIKEYALKAWRCGAEHHNRSTVQKRLYDELKSAAEAGVKK